MQELGDGSEALQHREALPEQQAARGPSAPLGSTPADSDEALRRKREDADAQALLDFTAELAAGARTDVPEGPVEDERD